MSTESQQRNASLRRMLLALDAVNCESSLIDAAALIAAKIEAELEALFLEDADLYAVADIPITQEISLSSAREREISSQRVEQALRSRSRDAEASFAAALARSRLKGHFQVLRAPRNEALSEAVARVDVMLLQPAQRTIIRLRVQQQPQSARVFAICGDSDAGAHTRELAARLAVQDHKLLELVSTGGDAAAQTDELERRGLHVNCHTARPDAPIEEWLRDVDNRAGNILLVAADLLPASRRAKMVEELSRLRCQVLLVN